MSAYQHYAIVNTLNDELLHWRSKRVRSKATLQMQEEKIKLWSIELKLTLKKKNEINLKG